VGEGSIKSGAFGGVTGVVDHDAPGAPAGGGSLVGGGLTLPAAGEMVATGAATSALGGALYYDAEKFNSMNSSSSSSSGDGSSGR
jgi:hypothetical protein